MEWKRIPSLDGYEASDTGEIRSMDRVQEFIGYRGATCRRVKLGRVLKLNNHSAGYLCCTVTTLEGKQTKKTVHSLVMEAFHGPRPKGMWINHLNGNKKDNRLENLEYCTASDNQRHAVAMGLAPKPPLRRGTANSHKCRLDEDKVRAIRSAYAGGAGVARLARYFGVGDTTIRHIVNRTSWAWLD